MSEYRPKCPIHGIPDCSPLLNGCSIPTFMLSAYREAVVTERQRIAQSIEAHMGRDADYDDGLENAARIAREGGEQHG